MNKPQLSMEEKQLLSQESCSAHQPVALSDDPDRRRAPPYHADRSDMTPGRTHRQTMDGHTPDPRIEHQMDSMFLLHQHIARRFSDALADHLERTVDVQLVAVELVTYSQFAYSRTNPTCMAILQAVPLPSDLALDFRPSILYPILDCLLGGGREPVPIPERPATEIEQRLARLVAEWLLEELHDAWEHVLAVNLKIDRFETNAPRVRLVSPSEEVVTVTFRIRLADQTGELTLCLPVKAIGRMAEKLTADEWCSSSEGRQGGINQDRHVEVVVRATTFVASDRIPAPPQPGDILLTDLDADAPVEVTLDGVPSFRARVGAMKDRKAVVIDNPIASKT